MSEKETCSQEKVNDCVIDGKYCNVSTNRCVNPSTAAKKAEEDDSITVDTKHGVVGEASAVNKVKKSLKILSTGAQALLEPPAKKKVLKKKVVKKESSKGSPKESPKKKKVLKKKVVKSPAKKNSKTSCAKEDKILNPETGNCIIDNKANREKVGMSPKKVLKKKVVKKSPSKKASVKNSKTSCAEEGKILNPETGNCIIDNNTNRKKVGMSPKKVLKKKVVKKVKSPAKKASVKNSKTSCAEEGKILNPETGNCIIDNNTNRKKIGMSPKKVLKKKVVKKSPAKKTSKKCSKAECAKEGKLCNEETGNCIIDNNANRKKLGMSPKKTLKKPSKKTSVKKTPEKKASVTKSPKKDYSDLTYNGLRDELGRRGLIKAGTKVVMIQRLQDHDSGKVSPIKKSPTEGDKYAGMNLTQLRSIAKAMGLVGYSRMNRAPLVAAIKDAEKKAASPKSPEKKASVKKSPEKKASVKKSPEKKASVKKSPEKKASVKKSPEKKASVKKSPEKKASVKKSKDYDYNELTVPELRKTAEGMGINNVKFLNKEGLINAIKKASVKKSPKKKTPVKTTKGPTVAELKVVAERYGVTGLSKMKKNELIRAIRAAKAKKAAGSPEKGKEKGKVYKKPSKPIRDDEDDEDDYPDSEPESEKDDEEEPEFSPVKVVKGPKEDLSSVELGKCAKDMGCEVGKVCNVDTGECMEPNDTKPKNLLMLVHGGQVYYGSKKTLDKFGQELGMKGDVPTRTATQAEMNRQLKLQRDRLDAAGVSDPAEEDSEIDEDIEGLIGEDFEEDIEPLDDNDMDTVIKVAESISTEKPLTEDQQRIVSAINRCIGI